MRGALGNVPTADVAEHERHILSGIDLKHEVHAATTFRAAWIFRTLDPVGPTGQLVAGSGHGNGFGNAQRLIVESKGQRCALNAGNLLREVKINLETKLVVFLRARIIVEC